MTTTKPLITYLRTMYVRVTDRDMFNQIKGELYSFYAQGDSNLCVSWEDLTSYIDEENEEDTDISSSKACEFILEAYNNAKGEIGDVVFYCD